jgi:GxxExxY protein
MGHHELLLEDAYATKVIGISLDIHSQMGPGLLESAYKKVLAHKLQVAGLFIEVEKKMPLVIDGIEIESGYFIDILV